MKNGMIALSILLLPFVMQAQNPEAKGKNRSEMREKIEEMRVEYVKNNLGLSEAQNEKFIPLYKENLKKMGEIRNEQRALHRDLKLNFEMKSEGELEKILDKKIEIKQKMVDLEKVTLASYKKVIPTAKIVKLEMVERDFKSTMMKRAAYKNKQGGKGMDRQGAKPQEPQGNK